jgi:predicted Mrr-cat superfamily restriction endonuclease
VTDQLWVVRAGEKARHADDFRSGSFIAIGFEDFFLGDLGSVTEPELRGRADDPAQRNSASQLAAFAYHLDVGDYVIVPLLPKERRYLVGQVTGPYIHVAPPPRSGSHRRPVTWLGVFPREGLSAAGTNTLGAIQTIFRPTAVEAELRALIAGLSPIAHPAVGEQETASAGLGDRVGFQNSATSPDLGFYAARSYSLIRPPRTGRCLIRSWERSATGWPGRGGRSWRLR